MRKLASGLFSFLLLALLGTHQAFAHTGVGIAGGFFGGFKHPIHGLDHVVAMVAVGLWGAFLGRRATWTLPVVFPFVMAIGGVLGVLGVPFPGVETGIALSGVVLGLAVLFGWRPKLWLAAALVGIFALFHGHAHGAELPEAANAVAYSIGFVIATGLLHIVGILLGHLTKWKKGEIFIRVLGAAVALTGLGFLFGIL